MDESTEVDGTAGKLSYRILTHSYEYVRFIRSLHLQLKFVIPASS